ncbi:MAG: hypothetical protein ACP5D2_03960 [Candidatus Nanoarchaeia archaeon]
MIKIRFCPKCKSKHVRYMFTLRNLFGIMPRQICDDCGYQAAIFPQIEVEESKIKKLEKNMKQGGEDILICAECGSKNINPDMRFKGDDSYTCKDCGYHGKALLMQVKPIKDSIKRKSRKKSKKKTSKKKINKESKK